MTGDIRAGTSSLAARHDGAENGRAMGCVDGERETGGKALSVLLIDDSDDEAREIVAALIECGRARVTVEHVSDPKQAEHIWRQGRHDLVIIDVWLGSGISVDLVYLLTSLPCACPIVMLSRLSSEELLSYFTDSDLFIHSKQNISPGALARTLDAALSVENSDI